MGNEGLFGRMFGRNKNEKPTEAPVLDADPALTSQPDLIKSARERIKHLPHADIKAEKEQLADDMARVQMESIAHFFTKIFRSLDKAGIEITTNPKVQDRLKSAGIGLTTLATTMVAQSQGIVSGPEAVGVGAVVATGVAGAYGIAKTAEYYGPRVAELTGKAAKGILKVPETTFSRIGSASESVATAIHRASGWSKDKGNWFGEKGRQVEEAPGKIIEQVKNRQNYKEAERLSKVVDELAIKYAHAYESGNRLRTMAAAERLDRAEAELKRIMQVLPEDAIRVLAGEVEESLADLNFPDAEPLDFPEVEFPYDNPSIGPDSNLDFTAEEVTRYNADDDLPDFLRKRRPVGETTPLTNPGTVNEEDDLTFSGFGTGETLTPVVDNATTQVPAAAELTEPPAPDEDPLAWLKEAGIDIDEPASSSNENGTDDEDPLAWLREMGIDPEPTKPESTLSPFSDEEGLPPGRKLEGKEADEALNLLGRNTQQAPQDTEFTFDEPAVSTGETMSEEDEATFNELVNGTEAPTGTENGQILQQELDELMGSARELDNQITSLVRDPNISTDKAKQLNDLVKSYGEIADKIDAKRQQIASQLPQGQA